MVAPGAGSLQVFHGDVHARGGLAPVVGELEAVAAGG